MIVFRLPMLVIPKFAARMNTPISTSPRISFLVRAVRGESGTNLTSAPSMTIPIGTLTKKIHRHDDREDQVTRCPGSPGDGAASRPAECPIATVVSLFNDPLLAGAGRAGSAGF